MEKNKDKKLETVTGAVEEIVFYNEENGYAVLAINDNERLLTVVGNLLDPAIGEELEITGSFVVHQAYGLQLKAETILRKLPQTAAAIFRYLASGAIKGIGPVTARKVVDLFGDKTFEVIEKKPHELTKIKGITEKKAESIGEEYKKIFGVRSLMAFLATYEIDAADTIKIWRTWGDYSAEMIKENPYRLCDFPVYMDFAKVDAIAMGFGMNESSAERVAAGIIYVLRHNLSNGHTCLPYGKLVKAVCDYLSVTTEETDVALERLAENEDIITETLENNLFLYLPDAYEYETYIAGRVDIMLRSFPFLEEDCEKEIDALQKELNIEYAMLQRRAISSSVCGNMLIITGGPGTGKTTTLNAIIKLLEKRGKKVALTAPTGRAAKRMSELTGKEAKTIHRLLEVEFDKDGHTVFKRNLKNPLGCDVIVVDEMSMVDSELFCSLLRALKLSVKIIMVGDRDQLPSVGAGNVLGDLIDSGRILTVHLNEVFRQAQKSLIVTNAHKIVLGELPDITCKNKDFFVMQARSEERTLEITTDLVSRRLPAAYGYSPLWDIQVITPSRIGPAGTYQINRQLQEALNPKAKGKEEVTFVGSLFREGDKVMQIKNNYDIIWRKADGEEGAGVYNGDIGVIVMIDKPSRTVLVNFEDREAEYIFEMLGELELAYAVTVHKSQGSEFECVILPLFGVGKKLSYRNLLYTAVTRAKKNLIIVGDPRKLAEMTQNNKKTLRYTMLKEFLTSIE